MPKFSVKAWREEGQWTVHVPVLRGVFGIGSTLAREEGLRRFVEARSC
jgi:hypothetical protein